MNESSNTLKDLLSEQQLKEYFSKEYPFNTNFLGTILKEKLKEDPDYELWAPFFYCKNVLRRKDLNTPSVIYPPLTFISNKGNLAKYKNGEYVAIPTQTNEGVYATTGILEEGTTYFICMLHRALASVFVPLPSDLKLHHPKNLQVNHIDGVKSNFSLGNLEWTTDGGNKTHAVDNGLIKSGKASTCTKPVKGKIEFGPYTGYEFILHGKADFKEHGFTQQNINACCQGLVRSHKNCSWSYATDDELNQLPHGLTEIIKKDLSSFRKRKKK